MSIRKIVFSVDFGRTARKPPHGKRVIRLSVGTGSGLAFYLIKRSRVHSTPTHPQQALVSVFRFLFMNVDTVTVHREGFGSGLAFCLNQ